MVMTRAGSALIALILLYAMATAAQAAEVRPLLKVGVDVGGDTIATAFFVGGSTETIKANEGFFVGGGVCVAVGIGVLVGGGVFVAVGQRGPGSCVASCLMR